MPLRFRLQWRYKLFALSSRMTTQKKPFRPRFFLLPIFLCLASLISLSACSPKYDWREVNDAHAPFVVLFPAKPNYHTKELELDGIRVKMTMAGADIDKLSFAVAYAKIETTEGNSQKDQQRQERVLNAMQIGMIKNIQGSIVTQTPNPTKNTLQVMGRLQNGKEIKLVGRFVSHGSYVVQAVMLGDEKSFTPELLDMFFGSFKLK